MGVEITKIDDGRVVRVEEDGRESDYYQFKRDVWLELSNFRVYRTLGVDTREGGAARRVFISGHAVLKDGLKLGVLGEDVGVESTVSVTLTEGGGKYICSDDWYSEDVSYEFLNRSGVSSLLYLGHSGGEVNDEGWHLICRFPEGELDWLVKDAFVGRSRDLLFSIGSWKGLYTSDHPLAPCIGSSVIYVLPKLDQDFSFTSEEAIGMAGTVRFGISDIDGMANEIFGNAARKSVGTDGNGERDVESLADYGEQMEGLRRAMVRMGWIIVVVLVFILLC